MSLREALLIALRALRAHRLRSTLTGAAAGTTSTGTVVETNTVQFLSANIIGTTDIWVTTNIRNLTAGSV
jgi:hypothetical protein